MNYASEVRRFLMERLARVSLVMFTERVFPEVLEEVVLVLAEGPAAHFDLHQARNIEDLIGANSVSRSWKPDPLDAKWTPSLMSTEALEVVYVGLEAAGDFTTLDHCGETTLGMVTGSNRYFAMSPARARELGIAADELIALSPPGSGNIRKA